MRRHPLIAVLVPLAIGMVVLQATAFAAGQQQFPQGRFTSPLTAADFMRYGGQMDANFQGPGLLR